MESIGRPPALRYRDLRVQAARYLEAVGVHIPTQSEVDAELARQWFMLSDSVLRLFHADAASRRRRRR